LPLENDLGTCWVGAFQEEEVSRSWTCQAISDLLAIVPVGYPGKVPKPTPRYQEQGSGIQVKKLNGEKIMEKTLQEKAEHC